MSLEVVQALVETRAALERVATPQRAVQEKRYLKSELTFLGATVPQTRALAKSFARAHQKLTRSELRALAVQAWRGDIFELRSWSLFVLEAFVSRLKVDDVKWLEPMIRKAGTWAHVDELAAVLVGPLTMGTAKGRSTLRRWAHDENFWVRRSALLAHLLALRSGGGDFAEFERLAVPMLTEREFFIRKAIGWVLREVSKKRPALSYGFLKRHLGAVSGLTLREGAKYLSGKQRSLLGLK